MNAIFFANLNTAEINAVYRVPGVSDDHVPLQQLLPRVHLLPPALPVVLRPASLPAARPRDIHNAERR